MKVDLLKAISQSVDQLNGQPGTHLLVKWLDANKDKDAIEVDIEVPVMNMHDMHVFKHDHEHEHEHDHDMHDMTQTLRDFGFSERIANKLLGQYDLKEIAKHLEYANFADEHGLVRKSKHAYFVSSISGNWRAPKGLKRSVPWYAGMEDLIER